MKKKKPLGLVKFIICIAPWSAFFFLNYYSIVIVPFKTHPPPSRQLRLSLNQELSVFDTQTIKSSNWLHREISSDCSIFLWRVIRLNGSSLYSFTHMSSPFRLPNIHLRALLPHPLCSQYVLGNTATDSRGRHKQKGPRALKSSIYLQKVQFQHITKHHLNAARSTKEFVS